MNQQTHNHNHNHNLSEGLEQHDLKHVVHSEIHIDEFKSKLGDDKDVIVVSFKVDAKEPANDLVAFIEKGYDWVLDADVSSGEIDDGSYIVFLEMDREPEAVDNLAELVEDLERITDLKLEDWRVRYYKGHTERKFSKDALETMIPLTPEDYESKYGKAAIDDLKTAAGLPVDTKAPKNDFTESLRNLAGIAR